MPHSSMSTPNTLQRAVSTRISVAYSALDVSDSSVEVVSTLPTSKNATLVTLPTRWEQSVIPLADMSSIQPGDSSYGIPGLATKDDGNEYFGRTAQASPTTLKLPKPLSGMRSWTRKLLKLSWSFLERHWITSSIVVMVSIVAISMAIGWSLRLRFFKAETFPPFLNSTNDVSAHGLVSPISYSRLMRNDAQILLSANLISIDPVGQTMMIDWAIYDDVQQEGDCQDVNIYIDQ